MELRLKIYSSVSNQTSQHTVAYSVVIVLYFEFVVTLKNALALE